MFPVISARQCSVRYRTENDRPSGNRIGRRRRPQRPARVAEEHHDKGNGHDAGEPGSKVGESAGDVTLRMQAEEVLLKAGALQRAIFNSANFSSIATDAKGVIDLQCWRGADARLHGRRSDEQDHARRHFRSAGADRARQGIEQRARDDDHAWLRGPGLQGFARNRGHLRTDLYPKGRKPVPGSGVRHGAARRAGHHYRLSVDRHRQHRAQAGRSRAEESSISVCATSSSTHAR